LNKEEGLASLRGLFIFYGNWYVVKKHEGQL